MKLHSLKIKNIFSKKRKFLYLKKELSKLEIQKKFGISLKEVLPTFWDDC